MTNMGLAPAVTFLRPSVTSACPTTTAVFFFSSRRRHTRYIGDWSSDVCSSDLDPGYRKCPLSHDPAVTDGGCGVDRAVRKHLSRSEERRVGKSVDLGGRRII